MVGGDGTNGDCASINLSFEDGSISTIHYFCNGHKGFAKERVEVFSAGNIYTVDNFRRSFAYGTRGGRRTRRQDKGHKGCIGAFIESLQTGASNSISREELFEVSYTTIEADRQIKINSAKNPAIRSNRHPIEDCNSETP